MSYIKDLQNEIEEEKAHSAFLEKLLRILCGDGWSKLTMWEAERCKVLRPHNKPGEFGRAKVPAASKVDDLYDENPDENLSGW